MKLTVVWKADAENELGELWLAAADRAALTEAADQIDRALRDSRQVEQLVPSGESSGTISVFPLKALLSVNWNDCRVTVLAVARTEIQ